MPFIIIGCGLGYIYYFILIAIFPDFDSVHPATYAIIASSAMLCGSCRITFSLAVMMMETT